MEKFENPNARRAKIFEDKDVLKIRINSKVSPFITAFICFWLCGWAFGEVTVIHALLSGNAGGGAFFMLAWLGAWTVGGFVALVQALWGIAGYERLSLSKDGLIIERHVPILRRSRKYDITHIKDFRVRVDSSNMSMLGKQNAMPLAFINKSEGVIKFDYGFKTPGFGISLEEAEARMITEKLTERHADLTA